MLLLLPVVAEAHSQVTLNEPGEPLDAGAEFQFQAQVTGPGAGGGCHWAVTDQGRRLESWDGVSLVEQEGGARFRAQGWETVRTLQVRATARRDPAAFAVVTVQVRAGNAADAPAAETKGPAPKEPPLPAWNTPFSRTGATPRNLQGIAWDPSGAPAIVALENLGNRARVIRIGLDGGETVISRDAPDQLPLDEQSESLAVLPGGDIVVADTRNHRICRLTRDGALTTLAGTGGTGFNGDTGPEGRPRPATEAALALPHGIAVTAAGEVVFADHQHHRIRRFIPGGTVETIAGNGAEDLQLGNDLARRHPATACSIFYPHDLAAAPDGRIVFALAGLSEVFVLHPDGTLGRAREIRGAARITVAEDNAVVAWDGHQWLLRLAGEAEPAVLCETRLPLQGLAPVPGGGVLALGRHLPAVYYLDPPRAGWGLEDRVNAAWAAFQAGDRARAGAIRASLARWAEAWPPSAEVVRDHLLGTRPGSAGLLPKLPEELQTEPFEWLRGDHRGAGIRARIALHTLDQAMAPPR
jgi:hypothetical protein